MGHAESLGAVGHIRGNGGGESYVALAVRLGAYTRGTKDPGDRDAYPIQRYSSGRDGIIGWEPRQTYVYGVAVVGLVRADRHFLRALGIGRRQDQGRASDGEQGKSGQNQRWAITP
ncbi:MAG: hypothetical protein BZY88_05205 [SAR202 cluster bacterium Io17-Chloro-G9]|nr:MAG: hypothetical protein BZY88_05205 [SAR202 cluster bacterium Io17-Chloro-G9]